MAINNIDELIQAPGLMPKSDAGRITRIKKNRRLLKGDFSELDADFSVNWFARVVDFFPEFLFSETPEIQAEANPRFQEFLNEIADPLMAEFLIASGDMLAFGSGVLATHPRSPLVFNRFDPELHFEIVDLAGDVVADVLLRIRGEAPDQKLDVYHYPIEGGASWRIYDFAGASFGEQLGEVEIPDRTGRQVVILESGEGSIFDGMKQSVSQLSRILDGLGDSIEKNSRPHLIGPEGLLKEDDDGRVYIDRKGSYLPINEGDEKPEYLTWDSPVEATQFSYAMNEKNLLAFAGLSQVLFDPSQLVGNISGRALKRLLLPFVAKLGFYARVNSRGIKEAIRIINQNLQNAGQPYFSYRNSDLKINWRYSEIFEDVNAQADIEPEENESEGD